MKAALYIALSIAAAALGLFETLPGAAAQDAGGKGDCILDNCADQKPLPPYAGQRTGPQPSGASAPGDFDFYVLALSWSPGFCDNGGAEKARAQCASGANLGFVVHGLWPQYQQGFPSDCGRGGWSPSQIALQSVAGVYPDQGLARYEWRKHGTCSGKSPTDYFADVRRARDTVTIPPPFINAHETQNWTPLDIQRAFIASNPRLRPGMMAVECEGNELSEVRICMSKDVRNFVACPEVSRHFCYTREISVSAMR